jgi:predicted nuclease of predicted toxin-antitoxin system
MKFLIDAQLPRRLAHQLRTAGFEAIHTLDLPQGNRSILISRKLVRSIIAAFRHR